jgi:branched-chain amino acid transport system ATP-binding protein
MSELVLEVAQLRASYGKVQALHDIDLRLERGSIATVIGPNGAGKSTCSTPSWGCCRRRNGALSRSGGGRWTLEQRVMAGIALVPGGANCFPA